MFRQGRWQAGHGGGQPVDPRPHHMWPLNRAPRVRRIIHLPAASHVTI
jgi:hypothetical protein